MRLGEGIQCKVILLWLSVTKWKQLLPLHKSVSPKNKQNKDVKNASVNEWTDYYFTGLSVSRRQNKQMCLQNRHFPQTFIASHHKGSLEICLCLFITGRMESLPMGVCP